MRLRVKLPALPDRARVVSSGGASVLTLAALRREAAEAFDAEGERGSRLWIRPFGEDVCDGEAEGVLDKIVEAGE